MLLLLERPIPVLLRVEPCRGAFLAIGFWGIDGSVARSIACSRRCLSALTSSSVRSGETRLLGILISEVSMSSISVAGGKYGWVGELGDAEGPSRVSDGGALTRG